MRAPDPWLPTVFTRDDGLRAGLSKHQMDTRVRNGVWRTLSRGAYCLAKTWDVASPEDRQVLGATAAIMTAPYPAWASHASGAAIHELPVPGDQPAWITRQPPSSTRYSERLTLEVAALPVIDQWTIRGVPVTSRRRTVADCLRHLLPHQGLAVADAAERATPGILEGVRLVLGQQDDWPYAARAWKVLPLVDGRRESPLESWSYWYMHRFGVPMPEPQVDIYDERGVLVGRADAWWHQYAVAGEADGRQKYEVREGESLKDAQRRLYDEKVREDAFRRTGAGMIRWGSDDVLRRPGPWAARVMRELAANPHGLFRGRAVSSRRHAA